MHIPSTETKNIDILTFDEALEDYECSCPSDFSRDDWLYVPCTYSEYRYILGTKGKRPLICVGINPSTAEPNNLDNTLKSVERIALGNGYDSFIMFNVYAQRATRPDDMDRRLNISLHNQNMKAFEYVLKSYNDCAIWAAWGTIIEMRDYLPECVCDMAKLADKYNVKWYTAGKKSKSGHPHHPLYLKKDSALDAFDVSEYIKSISK